MKATVIEMQSKINQLKTNSYAALKDGDGHYNGLFGNPMEAKAFGLMIMAAATACQVGVKSKHDSAIKLLGDCGIELKWLDPSGSKILTTTAQSGGSALVTTEMFSSILSMFEKHGVFEADALPVPMGTGQTLQPRCDTLLDMRCEGEGKPLTAQDIVIGLVSHLAKTYTILTAYSIELDEDSAIALGELIASVIVRSFGYGIDRIAFLGDGTSTYLGVKGIAGALRAVDATIANIKSLVVASGNLFSEFVIGDFTKMKAAMPDYADDGSAKFYMHRYIYYTIYVALALASTGASANEVIQGAGQRLKLIGGDPVQFTQVMPRTDANSQIAALFANLRLGAQLGRRGVMEIRQSDQAFFTMRLIGVLAARRLSINIHGVGDTTKAGPIIGLISAAS
jgi:HK97 family phage major capsid protein